jgi:HAD superfamily hydrolase (TIGR01450 family)
VLHAPSGATATGLAGGRVAVEGDHDPHAGRPPARQLRQQPGDTAVIAAPAGRVEEVVAIDEQKLDVGRSRVRHHAGLGCRDTIGAVLLLVDLDGVVYRGPDPVPGMPALLRRRRDSGDTIIYVTNNSRWHRSEYLARLESMGAPVRLEHILTSARGTALALAHRPRPPGQTMVLGGAGLARELADAGLATLPCTFQALAERPEAVAVGIDFDLDHERLSVASDAVRGGATFVATNRDPVFPVPGRLMAGAGAIVAAVAAAAGREPDLVVGKPEPGLLREAAAVAGIPVEDAVVIGDGLRSDILAARRVGARSVLVLTGVSTAHMADALPADERPTVVAQGPADLEGILAELALGRVPA